MAQVDEESRSDLFDFNGLTEWQYEERVDGWGRQENMAGVNDEKNVRYREEDTK